MKISYAFILKDFEGRAVKDENGNDLPAFKALANVILNSVAGGNDTMKRFRWAQELYQDQGIDLDRAGQEDFKKALYEAPGLNVLIRGILLEPLENG